VHNLNLILTLTGGLVAALAFGYLTHRLGLSPIVGYLLAGMVVGPHTPGFVADQQIAEQLAEIGVILLMFGVGLQFHIRELMAVRKVAVPGAIAQSLVATVLGAVVARGFGWSWGAGIVFGLALSVASTVVLVRVLSDNRDLHTPTGHIAVGWLVVEDIFTVVVLVILPALFIGTPAGPGGLVSATALALLKIALLVGIVLLVGGRAIPWLLDRVVATRSRELFTLTVLVLALGIAVGSTLLFQVSMALGAFVAGLVVGRSEFSLRAATEALPMRDAFAVLFFVSVGMLLNPRHLLEAPGLVAATLGVIMLGKPLAAMAIVLLLKYPFKVALAVAIALAQIGEFSFILANVGKGLGILSDLSTNTLVASAIISITLNPLLYRGIQPLEAWMLKRPKLWNFLNAPSRMRAEPGMAPSLDPTRSRSVRHRTVVIGYGPVGQTLTRLLSENGIHVTVIELDVEKVRRLRANDLTAVYGDAGHRETLENAGVAAAGSLIISSSALRNPEEVIRLAREINPNIQILARSSYIREMEPLRQAGASVTYAGEAEVALALTETLLRDLGATPEQIDKERARVHLQLFGQVRQDGRPLRPQRRQTDISG
jgi:CPA2 family monovalent cation:H+ antiporter-2